VFISKERYPEAWQITLETPYIDKKLERLLKNRKIHYYLLNPANTLKYSSGNSVTIISLLLGPITRDKDYLYDTPYKGLCASVCSSLKTDPGSVKVRIWNRDVTALHIRHCVTSQMQSYTEGNGDRKRGCFREPNVRWKPCYDPFRFNSMAE
jgi:hypothetical protein